VSGDTEAGRRIAESRVIRSQIKSVLRAQLDAQIEEKRADASAAVSAARANARKKAGQAVAKAERKLANTINSEVNKRLNNRTVSDSKTWADPFVGLRGKYYFNDDLYFVGRGDYGGFGISSDQTYNIYAAFGMQVKENIVTEVGFRRVGVDYQDGNFSYDATFTGPFIGTMIRF